MRQTRRRRHLGLYDKPLVKDAGFLVLRGNLFDSAS